MDDQVQAIQDLRQKIQDLEKKVADLTNSLQETDNYLESPRVQIRNLEGAFKTLGAAPTADFMDGALVLTDISGTRKINVRINKVWYSVTVT